MLAPSGVSGLYGKKDILEDLPPFLYGGGMIDDVTIAAMKLRVFCVHGGRYARQTGTLAGRLFSGVQFA